ncbi:unnamed protein product, partial [Vitis vinifera]|uniref:Uncharacterized protein n=1 Tax=Vitis vinifera TaxID=29760 RepID=D7TYL8_VITVI
MQLPMFCLVCNWSDRVCHQSKWKGLEYQYQSNPTHFRGWSIQLDKIFHAHTNSYGSWLAWLASPYSLSPSPTLTSPLIISQFTN